MPFRDQRIRHRESRTPAAPDSPRGNNGSTTRDAPTGPGVRAHVEVVATTLDGQFPAVAELLRDAKADITAIADFPKPIGAR